MLWKAGIRQHASRRMLLYFIPVTIVSTPLGQMVGNRVSTDLVEAVGGVLVTFVAVFEIYQKRALFAKWVTNCCSPQKKNNKGLATADTTKMATTKSESSDCNSSTLEEASSNVDGCCSDLYDIGKKVRPHV